MLALVKARLRCDWWSGRRLRPDHLCRGNGSFSECRSSTCGRGSGSFSACESSTDVRYISGSVVRDQRTRRLVERVETCAREFIMLGKLVLLLTRIAEYRWRSRPASRKLRAGIWKDMNYRGTVGELQLKKQMQILWRVFFSRHVKPATRRAALNRDALNRARRKTRLSPPRQGVILHQGLGNAQVVGD